MTLKKSLCVWAGISLVIVMVASYVVFGTKTKIKNLILRGDNLFWSLMEDVPSDLEVTVKNGTVAINKPRPYCLMWNAKSGIGIFFDNQDNPVLADDKNCPAWATVGKNYLKLKEDNGSFKVYEINQEDNFLLNKKIITQFYKTNEPKLETGLWILYYSGPWLIWLGVFGWGLISCLWYSWWVKLALRIFQGRKDLGWEQIYGVVLFLMSGWYFLKYGVEWLLIDNIWGQNMVINFPLNNTLILVILALFWFSGVKIRFWRKT